MKQPILDSSSNFSRDAHYEHTVRRVSIAALMRKGPTMRSLMQKRFLFGWPGSDAFA